MQKMLLVIMLMPMVIFADDVETVDGIEWSYRVEDGYAVVSGCSEAKGTITIPSMLGGNPVGSIGEKCFQLLLWA